MNRYAEMLVFVRAAEDGNFSAAARNLALTPSAVSKLIGRMEDRLGVLQDVHWSCGLLGYFPTYQLGNVMSVQIWEAAQAALPGLEEQFERGDFSALGAWLRENLYTLGRKLTPKETLVRVAGGPIDPEPYLRYLREKYRVGITA